MSRAALFLSSHILRQSFHLMTVGDICSLHSDSLPGFKAYSVPNQDRQKGRNLQGEVDMMLLVMLGLSLPREGRTPFHVKIHCSFNGHFWNTILCILGIHFLFPNRYSKQLPSGDYHVLICVGQFKFLTIRGHEDIHSGQTNTLKLAKQKKGGKLHGPHARTQKTKAPC